MSGSHSPHSVDRCIAHKVERGRDLRCERPHGHDGRHRWEVDDNFYPFGRLDPDDPISQAIVRAFNKAAVRDDR